MVVFYFATISCGFMLQKQLQWYRISVNIRFKYRGRKTNMLGERIACLRKEKQISQEELADVLCTSRQAISKWERGESEPDIDRLKDLAIYFNVSIDYLLGYDVGSTSLQGFIEKIKKSKEEAKLDVDIDEIKLVVSRNSNNFLLLVTVVDYLSEVFSVEKSDALIDLCIEYTKKAIQLFPYTKTDMDINELHAIIAYIYALQGRYDLVKSYLIENKVPGVEEFLADCEYELGNYESASHIASGAYLKSISLILNGNITQAKVRLQNNKIEDALDISNWSINFIKSIGKEENLFLDIIFFFTFIKAACQRNLKSNYQESIDFLKENLSKIDSHGTTTESIKFYYNKTIRFVNLYKDFREELYCQTEKLKDKAIYEDCLFVFKEVFGGQ